jgi:hypothetical protein
MTLRPGSGRWYRADAAEDRTDQHESLLLRAAGGEDHVHDEGCSDHD